MTALWAPCLPSASQSSVFILAFIINALAPTFGHRKTRTRRSRCRATTRTRQRGLPARCRFCPARDSWHFCGLYGLYLLYLGLPALMKAPQDKAIGYTAVVVVCAIVLSIVVTTIGGLIIAPAALGSMGSLSSSSAESQFPADSAMGKLEALGKSLEQSGAKMDRPQKRGDKAAETAARSKGWELFGGGKRVDPVSHRSVEAAGAGSVRRVSPEEQQRGAHRHGRHHGRHSGGLVWR